jgi:hypothetical protein
MIVTYTDRDRSLVSFDYKEKKYLVKSEELFKRCIDAYRDRIDLDVIFKDDIVVDIKEKYGIMKKVDIDELKGKKVKFEIGGRTGFLTYENGKICVYEVIEEETAEES